MTSGNLLLDTLEPRAVMAVGGCTAFFICALLIVHVHNARNYRQTLSLLIVSMALAGSSLAFSVLQFDDVTQFYQRAAVICGTASYLFASTCLTLLYRPQFSPQPLIFLAVVCLAGFVIFPTGMSARNWNTICQFTLSVFTVGVLLKSPDPMAPALRWVTIALCVFSALGMTPRLLSAFSAPAQLSQVITEVDTVAYRVRALVWAIMPTLIYACVTGVIHARIAKKLRNSADLDILTGAHSRRYLFETGEQLLLRRSVNEGHPATVLLIDVDHFKKFNDTWGHALGDDVLKHCVQCIRAVVRSTDAIIGRYGGEEFCVLLPGIGPDTAGAMAERVRRQIADNPYRHEDQPMAITVSIGVAQHSESGTLTGMINLADERLYRAKHSGRNRVIDHGGLLVPV